MKLSDNLIRQGQWLFRWRSYLPLAILPVGALAFRDYHWFSAAVGDTAEDWWDLICMAIALAGFGLRVLTVGFVPEGTSGRTTRRQHADVLNTTGMYSIVRHPIYLANFLIFLGFVLTFKSVLYTLFVGIACFAYYERIILAEEDFLESIHGERFRQWAVDTPTLLPAPRLWISPALAFSWRTALMREYHGLMLIAALFFASKLFEGLAIRGLSFRPWLGAEPYYVAMLATCTTFYLVVRFIRKRTDWLEVAGRGP
jgi:protein-S-isoprenylcysteine O-methyltransferase Ste14